MQHFRNLNKEKHLGKYPTIKERKQSKVGGHRHYFEDIIGIQKKSWRV